MKKKQDFDRVDVLSALGVFTLVSVWAALWAYPCPHPDQWSFLAATRACFGLTARGVAGRFALGVGAALVYLVLRAIWIQNRHADDDLPDRFFSARAAAIAGAAIFALMPYSWRAAQFLSPGFVLLVLIVLGVLLWLCGRQGRGLFAYSAAYLLLGGASGANPLGLVPLGVALVSDAVVRWRYDQSYEGRETDDEGQRRKAAEVGFSFAAAGTGFGFGAYILMNLVRAAARGSVPAVRPAAWWSAWTDLARQSIVSPLTVSVGVLAVVACVGLGIGRRLRMRAAYGQVKCRVLLGLLATAVAVLLARSVDRPERVRLQAAREYAALVAEDVRDAKFLFTDGRFDDLLRLEFAARGVRTVILNTMAAPTQEEATRLKALAPDPGERELFEAGGAEVFRAWAQERPDRLAESAWQLGGNVVRRYGRVRGRTCGTVMRCVDALEVSVADAADARFADWTRRIEAVAEGRTAEGRVLGRADEAAEARLDGLLWRAARLANERAMRFDAAHNPVAAKSERELARRLDDRNMSLRAQSEVIERMLPTDRLVLTPRESLEVALKRADFRLARRFAEEILAVEPENPKANFALGMANLEKKDYLASAACFERVLEKDPDEPAALNNLAIALMRLGQLEKAQTYAERAVCILPESAEIQRTLAEIRGAGERSSRAE